MVQVRCEYATDALSTSAKIRGRFESDTHEILIAFDKNPHSVCTEFCPNYGHSYDQILTELVVVLFYLFSVLLAIGAFCLMILLYLAQKLFFRFRLPSLSDTVTQDFEDTVEDKVVFVLLAISEQPV